MGRYLALLRRRDFALLWAGATLSILGDGLTWIALAWLVLELGGSAADVGFLVACYTGPVVVGGLAAGVLLDRFDRRRVLVADNLVRGLAVVSVPIAAAAGVLAPAQLYVVAAIYGLLNMISLAGVPSILPSLVDEDDLPTANAMETISFGLGGIAGPALAGALVGFLGTPSVLALDAATYAVFVGCLALIRTPSHASDVRGGHGAAGPDGAGTGGAGLGPALRFIRSTPAILAITVMYMSLNLGEGMLTVLFPIYARDVLAGDAATYGLLVSAFTGGVLVGAVAVGAVGWPWPLGRSIAAAQLLTGLALLGLAARPGLAGAVAVLGLAGLCASPLTIWAQTIRMRLIPPDMRGRVFGLLRTLMRSTPPAGGIVGGALLGAVGMPVVAALVAALVALPGLRALWHPALGPGADPTAVAHPTGASTPLDANS